MILLFLSFPFVGRIKDISWKSAKALMADVNFLKELKELDCDNITAGQQKIVQSQSVLSVTLSPVRYE